MLIEITAAKRIVGKRQALGAAQMQAADDLRLAVHQRILRDVQAECLEPRADLHQVLDQKALGAADVEHAVAGLEPEVRDDVLRDRNPAAVVAVTAIAVFARAIEILEAVFARLGDHFGRLRGTARGDVALGFRQAVQQIHFLSHRYLRINPAADQGLQFWSRTTDRLVRMDEDPLVFAESYTRIRAGVLSELIGAVPLLGNGLGCRAIISSNHPVFKPLAGTAVCDCPSTGLPFSASRVVSSCATQAAPTPASERDRNPADRPSEELNGQHAVDP